MSPSSGRLEGGQLIMRGRANLGNVEGRVSRILDRSLILRKENVISIIPVRVASRDLSRLVLTKGGGIFRRCQSFGYEPGSKLRLALTLQNFDRDGQLQLIRMIPKKGLDKKMSGVWQISGCRDGDIAAICGILQNFVKNALRNQKFAVGQRYFQPTCKQPSGPIGEAVPQKTASDCR